MVKRKGKNVPFISEVSMTIDCSVVALALSNGHRVRLHWFLLFPIRGDPWESSFRVGSHLSSDPLFLAVCSPANCKLGPKLASF